MASRVVLSRTKYLNLALLSGRNGLSIYRSIDSSSNNELTDDGPQGLGKVSCEEQNTTKYELISILPFNR